MPITFNEENKIFHLTTPNSSYIIAIMACGIPVHMYYGKKINIFSMPDEKMFEIEGYSFSPQIDMDKYGKFTLDIIPCEYPSTGDGDYRNPAITILQQNGSKIVRLLYAGYKIYDGKPELKGLPATYVEEKSEAQTLELYLYDNVAKVKVTLKYTVFNDYDAIARSTEVYNYGSEKIVLLNAQSACIDMDNKNFNFIHLHGSWARERHIKSVPLNCTAVTIDSKRGVSSHNENPFFALAEKGATENCGEVYGFNLIYSGNFVASADMNYLNSIRAYIGINTYNFQYVLERNESFQTPEAILVYSDCGFGKMSRTFHSLYRNKLCRGQFRDDKRPILLNLWETAKFNINEKVVFDAAKEAKELGIDLIVIDDGWFGSRNSTKGSLGDWNINKEKFPGGFKQLSDRLAEIDIKLGIWIEPEMVSPDSNLIRQHPEWCIHTPDRNISKARGQYVLDFTKQEVRDHLYNEIYDILSSADISYVKWDMNRGLSEVYSDALSPESQGEVSHRYVLGIYELMDRLTSAFPDILFEGCSAGGARFDGGILYYMPQIWVSDCTDAVERMYIQHGTSLVYPSSCMAAHVSDVPNHQLKRVTPFDTRTNIAMAGRFGYELDVLSLTQEEKILVKVAIQRYKLYEDVIHHGDMYRLISPYETDYTAWQFVSDDKSKCVLIYGNTRAVTQMFSTRIKLKGLLNNREYTEINSGRTYSSDMLENFGILIRQDIDYSSEMMIFELE